MANPRVSRGRRTQELLAAYYRDNGWPDAKSRPASLPGTDIYDVPFAPEVKATEGQDFTGALRQARQNSGLLLPFVVYRPRGYGEEKISLWLAVMSLADHTELLKKAGY